MAQELPFDFLHYLYSLKELSVQEFQRRSVISVEVTDGGSGYRAIPNDPNPVNVEIIPQSGDYPDADAVATATVVSGKVKEINLTFGGKGYEKVPLVTISGGGGSGAKAVAKIEPEVFRDITFAERQDFDKIYIDPPTLVLDIHEAQFNPGTGEFRHDRVGMYSNVGNLALYMNVRALVLVNEAEKCEDYLANQELITRYGSPIGERIEVTDPSVLVRKLAFDVAAFATRLSRFKSPVGMSQVIRIGPVSDARMNQGTMLAWEVIWQHSVNIGEPDNMQFIDQPDIAAVDVREVQVGFNDGDFPLVPGGEQDPSLIESGLTDESENPIRDRKENTEIVYYRRPDVDYVRPEVKE